MEEWKIGEIRQVNGEWYQCVKGTKCYECAFAKKHCNENPLFETIGSCSKYYRKDATSVIFKKLEKVGLPYYNSDNKLCQEYKCYIVPLLTNELVDAFADNRVVIEVKQNKKEDMEEKKLNLKPFDIQKAREGKPVCTRDGRKARIICFDAKGTFPIIALVDEKVEEYAFSYTADGKFSAETAISNKDLMMLPEKKEGWVNVYGEESNNNERLIEQTIYKTRKDAFDKACPKGYITTTKINWEE